MEFCWTTLQVSDMEASLSFYRDVLGLSLQRRFFTDQGSEIVFLGEGDAKIELICDGTKRPIQVGKDISWGFTTDSLDKTMALFASKGIAMHSGPFQPNPHIRFFYVTDPDGLKIQLVENIAAPK